MRQLAVAVDTNGTTLRRLSPSPSQYNGDLDFNGDPLLFYFSSVPVANSASDLATLLIISGVIILSLLSLSSIFHLRLRSRRSHHLSNFNDLWSVRLLLVIFVLLWVLNETLRQPFFRRRYLYHFLPALTLTQQANLCKVHVVLSLGFFEPGFLVTLLLLLNTSIMERSKNYHLGSIVSVFILTAPVLLLQCFFVFMSPLKTHLPPIMYRNSVVFKDDFGNKSVVCSYPLWSCVLFAAFGIAYSLGFVLSCWRVVIYVINKGIRVRINALAFSVMVGLPMQILFLGVSSFWTPGTAAYGGVVLAMFLCAAFCAAVGECILVIKPISEALSVGGDSCQWIPGVRRRSEVEREDEVDRSQ